jgi:hypothetical protein
MMDAKKTKSEGLMESIKDLGGRLEIQKEKL